MLNYIKRILQRFFHVIPRCQEHPPYSWATPLFGSKNQLTAPIDACSALSSSERTRIQEVLGTLFYNTRRIEISLYVALNDIGAKKSDPITTRLLHSLP